MHFAYVGAKMQGRFDWPRTLAAMSIWRKKRQKAAHMRRMNMRLQAPYCWKVLTTENSSVHASVARSYMTLQIGNAACIESQPWEGPL